MDMNEITQFRDIFNKYFSFLFQFLIFKQLTYTQLNTINLNPTSFLYIYSIVPKTIKYNQNISNTMHYLYQNISPRLIIIHENPIPSANKYVYNIHCLRIYRLHRIISALGYPAFVQ